MAGVQLAEIVSCSGSPPSCLLSGTRVRAGFRGASANGASSTGGSKLQDRLSRGGPKPRRVGAQIRARGEVVSSEHSLGEGTARPSTRIGLLVQRTARLLSIASPDLT